METWLCRKCKTVLSEMTISDGIFGLPAHKLFYCDHKECELFGVVVVAGIPTSDPPKPTKE